MAKRKKKVRQEWKPHWLLRILQFLWTAALSLVKLAIGGVATVLLIGIICGFVLIGAAGDYLQEDVIPNVSFDLENYKLDQTSFIYYVDAGGNIQQQQKIFTSTDRQWAGYDEIPENLIHAAVAIEDKRFYEHQGVDWITTVKACARMFFGDDSKGGSTITQQLIKNVTGEDSVTVQRKVQEIFRAQIFEMEYEKEVIMEWYLNTIYMGKGCYGVKSAALEYFGKDLADLTLAECASLISITNNPSLFDPYVRPQKNRERQLATLSEMKGQGWITEEEYDDAVAQEMVFTDETEEAITYTCPDCGFKGVATDFILGNNGKYYCPMGSTVIDIQEDLTSDMYSWFTEMVMDDVAMALAEQMDMEWNTNTKDICLAMIRRGGYHIYTTIDPEIQEIVDEVYTNLDNVPTTRSSQQLQSAIVVIDNRTGDVVAVAGSVGEKTEFDALSFATDARLQTGSVMKPLTVYAPAFDLGYINPASVIPDAPLYDNFPKNESRSYGGHATILTGICKSLNTTAVHTLDQIGFENSFDYAVNKFRLNLLEEETTESGRVLSDKGYSPLALGALTYGVTVREMANAYATFPNGGVFREARSFTKVYDSEGNLVLDNTQETEKILGERANNYINYCLRSVVTQGTGTKAALKDTAVAAKTGTTSSNRDRWFIGYTDYYTAAVWCGYRQPEEVRLTGSGVNPALRMWKQVMEKVHKGVEWHEVYDKSGMYTVTMCIDSGKRATELCKSDPNGARTGSAMIMKGDSVAAESCDVHEEVEWCEAGKGIANEFCKQVEGNTVSKRGVVKDPKKVNKYSRSEPVEECKLHNATSVKPPETAPTTPETTTPPATTPVG